VSVPSSDPKRKSVENLIDQFPRGSGQPQSSQQQQLYDPYITGDDLSDIQTISSIQTTRVPPPPLPPKPNPGANLNNRTESPRLSPPKVNATHRPQQQQQPQPQQQQQPRLAESPVGAGALSTGGLSTLSGVSGLGSLGAPVPAPMHVPIARKEKENAKEKEAVRGGFKPRGGSAAGRVKNQNSPRYAPSKNYIKIWFIT
jgi:hypothetical protein